MTREELIEFASWLDEGTDYFGKSYIEVKTDEWLKNIVAKPVLCDGCVSKRELLIAYEKQRWFERDWEQSKKEKIKDIDRYLSNL